MPGYQIRYTPYDLSGYDLSGVVAPYAYHVISFENKNRKGKTVHDHYHIYIETNETKQSIINHIRTLLRIPKVGRGQSNKYYSCTPYVPEIVNLEGDSKNTPGYVCKWGDIRGFAGWTPAEIENCVRTAAKKYLRQVGDQEALRGDSVAPARELPQTSAKPKNSYYDRLFLDYDFEKTTVPTIGAICKWIRVRAAMRQQAIPMNSLVVRYAESLHCQHAMRVFGPSFESDEKFLEDYFDKQAEYFSKE